MPFTARGKRQGLRSGIREWAEKYYGRSPPGPDGGPGHDNEASLACIGNQSINVDHLTCTSGRDVQRNETIAQIRWCCAIDTIYKRWFVYSVRP